MSISPQPGHPALEMLAPSVQNAGHMPYPEGTLMLAAIFPYRRSTLPLVWMRPE